VGENHFLPDVHDISSVCVSSEFQTEVMLVWLHLHAGHNHTTVSLAP